MKKLIWLLALLISGFAWSAVEITDLKVTPISPFGKVIVEFNVNGDAPSSYIEQYDCVLTCKEKNSGQEYVAKSVVGDLLLKRGLHTLEWDMAKDGIRLENKNVTFSVQYKPYDYLVIDLVANDVGVNEITYIRDVPEDGWPLDYRKKKLLFRRIEEDEEFSVVLRNSTTLEQYATHQCRISQPYYISVFPITKSQIDPSSSSSLYYEGFWSDIRWAGFSSTSGLDFNTTVGQESIISIFRSLRTSIGAIDFDLPTLLQLRYATAKTSDEISSEWFGIQEISYIECLRDYGGKSNSFSNSISGQLSAGMEYLPWPTVGLVWTTSYPTTCYDLCLLHSAVDVDGVLRPYVSSRTPLSSSETTKRPRFRLVFPTF